MERKQLEKEFHNKLRLVVDDHHVVDTRWSADMEETIRNNPLWANMRFYAIERKSRAAVLDWYKENTKGKVVLDYCCGNGEDGILIAKNWAAEVVGIDISDVSIANSKRNSEKAGVADRITHLVCDAEETTFEDHTFDVITEYGALHHLDLEKALSEMSRILKDNGKAICQEALGHNIFIDTYRRLTPHIRTEWEVDHILRKDSFDVARKYFRDVQIRYYHLVSLFAVPFRNTFLFGPLLSSLERIDDVLLSLPGIKWQAWQTVFVLSDPKKARANM